MKAFGKRKYNYYTPLLIKSSHIKAKERMNSPLFLIFDVFGSYYFTILTTSLLLSEYNLTR